MYNVLLITSELDRVPLSEYAEVLEPNNIAIYTLMPTDYSDLISVCEESDIDKLDIILDKLNNILNEVQFDEIFIKEGEYVKDLEIFINSHTSYNPVDVTYVGYHIDPELNYAIEDLSNNVVLMPDAFSLTEIPYNVFIYEPLELEEDDLLKYIEICSKLTTQPLFIRELVESEYITEVTNLDATSLHEYLEKVISGEEEAKEMRLSQVVSELSTFSVKNFFTECMEIATD